MRIIAGRWRGRRLKSPRGRAVRPTTDRVREAWMSALGSAVEDAVIVDLYAGSGALGLEALSRGACHVTFVELARGPLKTLKANVEALEAGSAARVIHGDALAHVERIEPGTVDLVLADPPYDRGLAGRLLTRFHERPFASELWVEHRSAESLPELPGLRYRVYGDTTLTIAEAQE